MCTLPKSFKLQSFEHAKEWIPIAGRFFVYGRKSGSASSSFHFPYNSDRWADSFQIWQVYAVALGNFLEYAAVTFRPIREVT